MTRHSHGHLIEKRRAFLIANMELAARAYPDGEAITDGWKYPAGQQLVAALRVGVGYSPKTSSQDIYLTNAWHYRELLKHPEMANSKKTSAPAKPPNAEAKFFKFISEIQEFLHPRVTDGLISVAQKMREELFAQAIREVIEDKDLERMRDRFLPILRDYGKAMRNPGTGPGPRMYLRQIMREIIDAYGPPTVTNKPPYQ